MADQEDVNAARNEQRRAALELANRSRQDRKVLRNQIKSGEVDPLDLIGARLVDQESLIEGWSLRQLLRATPGIGEVLLHEILAVFQASPQMKVRALSYARREQLAKLAAQAVNRRWPLP